jgi:hypothetical protein
VSSAGTDDAKADATPATVISIAAVKVTTKLRGIRRRSDLILMASVAPGCPGSPNRTVRAFAAPTATGH